MLCCLKKVSEQTTIYNNEGFNPVPEYDGGGLGEVGKKYCKSDDIIRLNVT